MTIGERLEEARKRRGISIREAAEATKVRGDYLLAMEENSMHKIPLPEIYKRGFLKNYARLLKLDPDKILADYEAKEIGRVAVEQQASRPDREPGEPPREVFGRMMLPDDDDEEPEAAPGNRSRGDESTRSDVRREDPPKRPGLDLNDNTLYLKIAAGLAAAGILALLIFVLVGLLRGSDTPAPDPAFAGSTNVPAAPVAATATRTTSSTTSSQPGTISARSLTVRAEASVTLIIEQVDPAERLYQGTLGAGDVITIEKQGPVSIRFTNGTALRIEQPNGQVIRPTQASVGRIVVQ